MSQRLFSGPVQSRGRVWRMHNTNFNSLYIVIPVYLRDSGFPISRRI